jgi:Fe-S-cluster-containing dehydrogenase component
MSDFNNQENKYWRSPEELALDNDGFSGKTANDLEAFLPEHFPALASDLNNPVSRRSFLSLMGASIALSGLAGCRRPVEKIIPYVIPPEEVIPGIPEYFATTMPFGLSAYGLVVESHEGRPTKIEGNPEHPSTLGAANSFILASILGLYDPDRSKHILKDDSETDWLAFISSWNSIAESYRQNQGQGLAIISESFSSPTLKRLQAEFFNLYPKAKWVAYEPISDENIYEGIKLATGEHYRPINHFEKAKVIFALDSDFMYGESENITAAGGFSEGRRLKSESDAMSRLYVAESLYTVTGGMADHRLRILSSKITAFIIALAEELKAQGLAIDIGKVAANSSSNFDIKWVSALAYDLLKNRGESLIVAGRFQPPIVHAIVYAINLALGNIGNTITFREIQDSVLPNLVDYGNLIKAMQNGLVTTLVVLGGNPAYNSPADLDFSGAVKRVKNTIHLGINVNETAQQSQWHIPESHYLESWGDAHSASGVLSIVQPLIEPLFNGHSAIELLNIIIKENNQSGYNIVRQTWQNIIPSIDFEKNWRRILHDGIMKGNDPAPIKLGYNIDAIKKYLASNPMADEHKSEGYEIRFCPSSGTFDGRYANNGWLQEHTDPITKLTWDNPALLGPTTAKSMGVKNGDMIRLDNNGRQIDLPVWIVPGLADNTIGVILGYGRTAAGLVGNGVGFNTYGIRTSDNPWIVEGVQITKTGESYKLASAQEHHSMEGRPIIREATLAYYQEHPDFAPEMVEHPPLVSLWDERKYDEGYQWGMAIDLNVCIGCNACTIACQSENNIPIVGKNQVAKGREMHWLRVDRYFSGESYAPQLLHMPVPCQHCENAPCEQVCPVQATMHDQEGLNNMVYNRCVGTRYCSNNCPYKVRRFNFFNYTKDMAETIKMAQNPDVTVRSRGVMEKCTYCIQRINRAKIKSKLENRQMVDGEIVTACQQTCPAGAIAFGNILEQQSRVALIKKNNRNYGLLAELNTKPRTTYLAKIRNPNPEIDSEPDNESTQK